MANMDKMPIMNNIEWLHMAMNMADIGVYAKNRENIAQKWKWNKEIMFKSYGKNKIDFENMAISFVFLPDFCPKGSTAHGSPEQIFMFLESLDHVEWENTQNPGRMSRVGGGS